jgi:phage shock protein PspC (stress-responsive transcriptional regulator)/tetrahydromethanopterin S-methyltransferase subunit G
MKPTIRVSIGGFAFNLENDAYQMIDDYLKKLNKHFDRHPEGKEIISDVEYRMAELLRMRVNDSNAAVTTADVDNVISIMGNPADFDDGRDEVSPDSIKREDKKFNVKRRLFRDTDNKMIAGVCSGLGSYFNVDPVLVRVVFVVLFVLLIVFSRMGHWDLFDFDWPSIVILSYIVLWIAMPKAKTLEQKIAMTGKDPGIDNVGQPLQQKRGSGVWKVIKVIFGIIIGLKLLGVLLALMITIAVFWGFNFDSHTPSLTTMLDVLALNRWDVKASLLITIILPLLGIAYLCYKLLFWKRLTVGDAVVSLLAFVVLIASACYVGGIVLNMANKHQRKAVTTEAIRVETKSNTLYVKQLHEQYMDANIFLDEDTRLLYSNETQKPSFLLMPEIIVRKDDALSTFEIEVVKTAIDESRSTAQRRLGSFTPDYSLTDSLLVVNPQVFNKQQPWDRCYYRIIIRRPAHKKVVFNNESVLDNDEDHNIRLNW